MNTLERGKRRARAAALVAVSVLMAGAIAGTASGGTSGWQQIWDQIRPLLSDPGTINGADNPVHWTKLKGVPVGFADGADNGVNNAGFGLKKNLVPNLEFAVDRTRIQQRVTGACAEGMTIQSVGEDGTVSCSPGGVVYQGGHDLGDVDSEPLGNSWATLGGALDLPSGAWSIIGVASLSSSDLRARCRLEAWVPGSQTNVLNTTTAWKTDGLSVPVTLIGAHDSATPFRTAVVCKDDGADGYWRKVRIVATQVSEVRTLPMG